MATRAVCDLCKRYRILTKRFTQWLEDLADTSDLALLQPGMEVLKLTTLDILRLATLIVRKARKQRILPKDGDTIISVLAEIIALRRECGLFYEQSPELEEKRNKQSDETHGHFVATLETVRTMIKQLFEELRVSQISRKKPEQKRPALQTSTDAMPPTNILERLSVADCLDLDLLDDLDHAGHTTRPVLSTASKPATRRCELAVQQGDQESAIFCLLKQCGQICTQVRDAWHSHMQGKTGLTAASGVTDTACQLIKMAVDKFTVQYPCFATYPMVAKYLNINLTTDGRGVQEFTCNGSTSQNAADLSDILCIQAYISFTLIRMVNDARSKNACNSSRVRETLAYACASHPFIDDVLEASNISTTSSASIAEWLKTGRLDSLWHDVMPYIKATTTLPIYAVIILQVYMDISDIVGRSPAPVLERMLNVGASVKEQITRYEKMVPGLVDNETYHCGKTKSPARELCKQKIRAAFGQQFMEQDHTLPSLAESFSSSDLEAMRPLMQRLPVMCGYLANSLEQSNHVDAIEVCNNGSLVLGVAHIYNIGRTSGLIKKPWEDMDYFLEVQGAGKMKIWSSGLAATSLAAAAKHYDMALGVKLQESSNNRGGKPNGARTHLPSQAEVAKKAVKFEPASAYMKSLAYAEKAVTTETAHDHTRFAHEMLHSLALQLSTRPSDEMDAGTKKQLKATKTLMPQQLLSLLHTSLRSNELQLCFAYRDFFGRCAKLTEAIKKIHGDSIRAARLAEGRGEGFLGHEMVSDILWLAAKLGNPRLGLLQKTILGTFALAINQPIEKRGAFGLEKARAKLQVQREETPKDEVVPAVPRGMKLTMQGGITGTEWRAAAVGGELQCSSSGKGEAGGKTFLEPIGSNPEDQEMWEQVQEGMLTGKHTEAKSDTHKRILWEMAVKRAVHNQELLESETEESV
ncbi:hypothetical protein LTR15_006325 [Elasticomyces elasticus]|nr:hypothetical protein LTR15_006325 [Elasticomyces elasticus]